MARYFVCFGVALFSTIVGSLSGLGGGVIIKPSLDALASSYLSLGEIGALSSITVFSMAVLSTVKGVRGGIQLDMRVFLPLAVSSAIGGSLGNYSFQLIEGAMGEDLCGILQSVMLLALMACVLTLYLMDKKCRPLHIRNKGVIFISGLILGGLAAFLGIGGGPVNVAALKLLFGLEEREQVFGSLFIILFAQGSKLISLAITGSAFSTIALPVLMIIGGMLGGSIGSSMAIRFPVRYIRKVFIYAVVLVMLITMTAFI